jgi:hypothetical protein
VLLDGGQSKFPPKAARLILPSQLQPSLLPELLPGWRWEHPSVLLGGEARSRVGASSRTGTGAQITVSGMSC